MSRSAADRRSDSLSTIAVRLGVAGIAAATLMAPLPGFGQRRLPAEDPEHSRIKYADSLTSLNHQCMVRKRKLNAKLRPVYVNRQPVGFC